jgi:methionyl-tRNA formyltransferase
MKIVFLGTPPVAASCLRHLAGTSHEIVAVGTHPDRIMGRGLKPHPTAVKQTALELGLPVHEIPDVKDPAFATWLRGLQADVLVLVAFVVLPDSVLATTSLGAVNLHGSLLPRWRGAAPVQRSIEAGETTTGLTVFRLDSGVDTGGILLRRQIEVGPDETSGEVLARLGDLGGPALDEALLMLSAVPAPSGERQDPALATRAPKLHPEEGRLDWDLPATVLHNRIRAFNPAPGCWTEAHTLETGMVRLKIWRTRDLGRNLDVPAGELELLPEGGVGVSCLDGALELVEVQAEGKPRRTGLDWFHGFRGQNPVLR